MLSIKKILRFNILLIGLPLLRSIVVVFLSLSLCMYTSNKCDFMRSNLFFENIEYTTQLWFIAYLFIYLCKYVYEIDQLNKRTRSNSRLSPRVWGRERQREWKKEKRRRTYTILKEKFMLRCNLLLLLLHIYRSCQSVEREHRTICSEWLTRPSHCAYMHNHIHNNKTTIALENFELNEHD